MLLICMSRKYKIRDQDSFYFISCSTVKWVDLFTRDVYREVIIESLSYCQQKKGLIVSAWCIMPNHIHLIIGTQGQPIQDILRDFKSYTSRRIKEVIADHPKESRREWLMAIFTGSCSLNKHDHGWQFWQQGSHPIELWDNYMLEQKLDYLHNNPVAGGWVFRPEDYVWSSARDYSGEKGMLDIYLID